MIDTASWKNNSQQLYTSAHCNIIDCPETYTAQGTPIYITTMHPTVGETYSTNVLIYQPGDKKNKRYICSRFPSGRRNATNHNKNSDQTIKTNMSTTEIETQTNKISVMAVATICYGKITATMGTTIMMKNRLGVIWTQFRLKKLKLLLDTNINIWCDKILIANNVSSPLMPSLNCHTPNQLEIHAYWWNV